MTKKDKVKTMRIPYSFWNEENKLNRTEILLVAEELRKSMSSNEEIRFFFDTHNGDMIITFFDNDDSNLDNYPLINWEQLECFFNNQEQWNIAKHNASLGKDVIIDSIDPFTGRYTGTSYFVPKEHNFGKDCSDLDKAVPSPFRINPPKGFG